MNCCPSFCFGRRWKSLRVGSGLYNGCGSTENSTVLKCILCCCTLRGLALACWKFVFKQICKNYNFRILKSSQHRSWSLNFNFFGWEVVYWYYSMNCLLFLGYLLCSLKSPHLLLLQNLEKLLRHVKSALNMQFQLSVIFGTNFVESKYVYNISHSLLRNC